MRSGKMGAGRRTQTFILNEKGNVSNTQWGGGGSGNFRNLRRSDLAGVIFGCSHSTFKECVNQLIFGLPAHHFAYVQNIEPGMPLFLFNYSDRKMHGIFEAASHGRMNINPYAWTTDGSEKTQYPAQVRVCIRQPCQPLSENAFRNSISENYYYNTHFWFELNHAQTDALMSLFLSTLARRSKENDFSRIVQNEGWLSKRAPSSSNGWQTASAHISNSHDYAHAITDVTSSEGTWPASCWESGGLSEEDSLQENWKSSCDKGVHAEGISLGHCSSPRQSMDSSKPTVSDDEMTATGVVTVHSNLLSESDLLVQGSRSKKLVANESKDDRELIVLEKLKRLAMIRGESSRNLASDVAVKEDPIGAVNHSPENDLKSMTQKNLQDQAMQKMERERLLHSLSFVDDTITKSLEDYLELQASTVAQMQQDITELKRRLDEACTDFQNVQVIKELANKNSLLEEKQVEMDSEIQLLKVQVKGLQELLSRREAGISQDEPAEIVNQEQSQDSAALIYLLGGHDGESWLGTLDAYSPVTDKITAIGQMPTPRSYAGATVLDGSIYIFGGGNGTLWYNSAEQYNPNSDSWTSCPSMALERGSLGGTCLGNKIFALGGCNQTECFSEVEMYDPLLGKWLLYGSMLQKRFALAATVFGGALYVMGGYDGKQYLKSAERLDPREGRWVQLEEMSTKRGSLSVSVLNDRLYAVGGFDGSAFLSSMEAYDPRAGSWLMADPMTSPRGYGATAVLGDSIYVMGGLGQHGHVDSVESYRDGFGWQVLSSKAIGKRSFLAALVL